MPKLMIGSEQVSGSFDKASNISYDNSTSQLGGGTVQSAIDELSSSVNGLSDNLNSISSDLTNINKKYGKYVNISFLFDKWNYLDYKDSPIDKGKNVFLELFKRRIFI